MGEVSRGSKPPKRSSRTWTGQISPDIRLILRTHTAHAASPARPFDASRLLRSSHYRTSRRSPNQVRLPAWRRPGPIMSDPASQHSPPLSRSSRLVYGYSPNGSQTAISTTPRPSRSRISKSTHLRSSDSLAWLRLGSWRENEATNLSGDSTQQSCGCSVAMGPFAVDL